MAAPHLASLLVHIRRMADPPAGNERSDGELLKRFARGRDEAAFELLLHRHGGMVHNLCRSILHDPHAADDALQATFLVLARKAASIRKRHSVASWLYGVAYRIAIRAKSQASRRRLHERQAPTMPAHEATPDLGAQELQQLLHEELQGLPEKYRAPLVLRYLEGKSNDGAALALGWPRGSISKRLTHALDLLRERLLVRGVALSSAGLGVVLAESAAAAAMPPALLTATLQSAILFAAGPAAAGAIPEPVAALTHGALQTMHATKLKIFAALALVLTIAGGGLGLLAYELLATPGRTQAPVELPGDLQAIVVQVDRADDAAGPEPYLSIRADGTAIFGNPRGDSRRLEARLSDRELQDLLRFVVRDNGFLRIDGARLEQALRGAAKPDGSLVAITVRAENREHVVHCQGLNESLTQRLPAPTGVRQLWAVQQRLERVVTWLHAGGNEGVASALQLANAELHRQFPEAPALTAVDLQAAYQEADGRSTITLERRAVSADRDPFTFAYVQIQQPAGGAAKVTVKANLGLVAKADIPDEHKPPTGALDVNPPPIASDATVKYDYDIVYVRAPRFLKSKDGKEQPTSFAEFGHPTKTHAGYDLMLLHPDGSEELLVEGGKGAVADPYVSFDGAWVYYAYFHDPAAGEWKAGADIYKIHVKSRKIVRLTHGELTPNTGVGSWSADYKTPEAGKLSLGIAGYNLGPCPLPGGKVAFTSNRDGVRTPRGYPAYALQLFVMDDDGKNVTKIGHLNVAQALHPVILKDGRIIFSTLESQGVRHDIEWGIWSIHPDGSNWGPVVSAYASGNGFHFQSQLSDGQIVVEEYYNQNTRGLGTYFKLPPGAPEGQPPFGPAQLTPDPQMNLLGGGGPRHFRPYGMAALTRFTHGNDSAAPLSDPKDPQSPRMGKVIHPSGAPDNHLLTTWTAGATANNNGPVSSGAIDTGIYLIKSGKPIWEPGKMLLIKNDPKYNEHWPRALVPYQRIYGVPEPAQLPPVRNDGKLSKHLPEGTPFGLVGTSSLYKRESFPNGVVPKDSVTATGNPYAVFNVQTNWEHQGADAGLYANSDIHAIRILAMEPATIPVAGRFFNHAQERFRILGEIPVRKFRGEPGASATGGQPLDPDGNPDTSFLAKIPADVAFTFQTLDKDGMVLNMAQTWHQVRPGESRNDCGGCHAHSQKPTLFKDTAAARPDYKVFDLTQKAPLVTVKVNDQSGTRWDVKDETGLRFTSGVHTVEYNRDVKPILERSCVACHSQKLAKPAGGLVLDDDVLVDGGGESDSRSVGKVPGTYRTLAKGGWRGAVARTRYVTGYQSRRSLLIWKVFGRRTDGLPEVPLKGHEAQHKAAKAIDFTGSVMPPPEAVAGTYEGSDGKKIKVAPLTAEDRLTLIRWIDLGCPLDRDFDPTNLAKRGTGWMLDDQRPTLALTFPAPGANTELTRVLLGMHDYGTGLDMDSFRVVADFTLAGTAPGDNLAPKFKPKSVGVWELVLSAPLKELPKGKLIVSVKDKQGNLSQIERTFSIGR